MGGTPGPLLGGRWGHPCRGRSTTSAVLWPGWWTSEPERGREERLSGSEELPHRIFSRGGSFPGTALPAECIRARAPLGRALLAPGLGPSARSCIRWLASCAAEDLVQLNAAFELRTSRHFEMGPASEQQRW
ncbi:hypothetical protein NDU88_002344 [Pleurodeles waltl]|uniref:Uncharacterized protein n=1 Tax=Pleurodeles waltl TaxID=8319 RepID=A0AAV7UVA9_PLEWA|nr:hypothetical protein NDU88_002344 [Pleurodeles waltl]